jgi:hypothetical protein
MNLNKSKFAALIQYLIKNIKIINLMENIRTELTKSQQFVKLFDEITLSREANEEFLNTLIKIIDFEYKESKLEVQKNKMYLMIVNSVKIFELFNRGRYEKIEELKYKLITLPDVEISPKSLKELYNKIFKNINTNEIPAEQNLIRFNNDHNLKLAENGNYKIQNKSVKQQIQIDEKEVVVEDEKNVMNLEIIKNSSPRNILNYEIGRKNSNFEIVSRDSSSGNLSWESNSKSIEDLKNKIDGYLKAMNECKDIPFFINKYFSEKKIDLFGNGIFVDTVSSRISNLPSDYKLKFLTIYSKVFYIFTEKQKTQILKKIKAEIFMENFFDDISRERIEKLLFYSIRSQYLTDLQIERDFISNLIKNKALVKFEDILKLMENMKTQSDLLDLTYILTLNYNLFFLEREDYHKLFFFIYANFSQNPKLDQENSVDFLYQVFIIFRYYRDKQNIKEDFLTRDSQTKQASYFKHNLANLTKPFQFIDIFESSEKKFCEMILDTLNKFFCFSKKNNLLSLMAKPCNLKFIFNVVELMLRKENAIYKSVDGFKSSLIKLEKKLYKNYFDFARNYIGGSKKKFSTEMYIRHIEAFENVKKIIEDLNNHNDRMKIFILPFGSITQFLGNSDSDLDIFVYIEAKKEEKLRFFKKLNSHINKEYNCGPPTISKRLITITFWNENKLKIDLNYFGFCSVLNSALLRVYSQCDERFTILAQNIKLILKHLKLNNTDDIKNYLNSYCWMTLLVTFLQDIVYPPVLPKILNRNKKFIKQIEAPGPQQKKKDQKRNYHAHTKYTFEDIIYNTILKDFEINDTFWEEIPSIYSKFQNNLEQKNQMSLAELLIKFLEFLIFYFKYDSMYVNCSFSGECFMNKNELQNLENKDPYYFQIYKNFLKKDKGDILIREPFDYTYNPAQTMFKEKTFEFIKSLKEYYFNLIQTGDFYFKN